MWKQDTPSDLVMQFTAEGNNLKLNGAPFYPVAMSPLPPMISAKQIPKDGAEVLMNEDPVRLSYSLEFEKENPIFIKALMTVMGLEGQMIKVDNIEIKALKAPDGEVSLFPPTINKPPN